jgi:hypothetical protein
LFTISNACTGNIFEFPNKTFIFVVRNNYLLTIKGESYTMARPIRETPILYGDAARRFEERMKVKRQEDPIKRERRLKVYNALIKTLKT